MIFTKREFEAEVDRIAKILSTSGLKLKRKKIKRDLIKRLEQATGKRLSADQKAMLMRACPHTLPWIAHHPGNSGPLGPCAPCCPRDKKEK